MKKHLFVLLAICLGIGARAQSCLPGGITFYSQADIDNFPLNYPNCTAIEGEVVIGASGFSSLIKNLNGLSNIQSFGRLRIESADIFNLNALAQATKIGQLTILDCPNLNSLSGLVNLTMLDTLLIYSSLITNLNLPKVTSMKMLGLSSTSVTGLAMLQSLNALGSLVISLPNLTNFNGIQQITTLDSLAILDIPLTNLNGLSQITSLGALTIANCPNLTDLSILQNFSALNSLSISLPALTDLNDLHNLVSLKNLVLSLPALSGFSGLENITALDSLALSNIPLSNLNGLSQINALGSLTVSNCGQLTNLSGLGNITALAGSLTITGNGVLPDLTGIAAITSVGRNLTVSGCPQLVALNNFTGMTSLAGSLTIADNAQLPSLAGLENLKTIGGELWIQNNAQFKNLGGLENLQSIAGSLYLANNNALTSIQELTKLTWIGHNLNVSASPALTSLNGLSGISVVPNDLNLVSNDALVDMSGLENLDTVYNQVYIQSNQNLTSLTGLGGLRYVGRHMDIYGHPALPDLMGLDNLEFVNDIGIFSNPGLLHLKGLEHLKTVKEDIYITSNPALLDVDGLNGLESVGGSLNIYNSNELRSLNGLNKLSSIGKDLVVVSNVHLADVSSLQNLSAVGGNLNLSYNPNLANCAVFGVCNQLALAPDRLKIAYNGMGCNSLEEITDECIGAPVVVEVFREASGTQIPVGNIRVHFSGSQQMLLRPTGANGRVRFGFLETGTFSLQLPEASAEVWTVSETRTTLVATNGKDSTHVVLLLTPKITCPEPTVTLGLPPNFRSCLVNSQVTVSTQNTGALPAENVQCTVVLPPELEIVEAVPPPAAANGDTLIFDFSDLKPFQTATAQLTVKTDCDQFLFGRTLCVEAFAEAANPCPVTPVAFSEIKLSAQCLGDTLVRFTVKNIGDAPTVGPHEYRVIQNEIARPPVAFSLGAQQSLTVDLPADASTWRLEATKFEDGTRTAAALENCNGLYPGWINMYWLDKGGPEYDFDCREVIGSFDPNQKSAQPAGVAPDFILESNIPLQYTIEFQNTGADTAFRVFLRDVLSSGLDVVSFRPVASSHPYTWQIRDQNKLEVLFFPIMLPDSNVNEPASHGFFTFEIEQKPDLPDGAVFENTASIIFDFNPPIITNTVRHTIGRLLVQVDEPVARPALWRVRGNPTRDAATFLSLEDIPGEKRFDLFDALGRPARTARFTGQTFEVRRDGLPAGWYVFRIMDGHGRAFSGKIMVAE